MLIDTHCHLDASEFAADRSDVIERAGAMGVRAIVIPAVDSASFGPVRDLAHAFAGGNYALGIHPMYVPQAIEADLHSLEVHIKASLDDPRFVAIGEIGLDFFVPELAEDRMRAKQEMFYTAQLDLALRYELPVLLHVRRSQDIVLKHLRHRSHIGGIAHAFNGSFQQAGQYIEQGFALGFGGAMTFTRALQIRRLAQQLPLESLVLETDNGLYSWRVDETYIKVKGKWKYLYRAVDKRGYIVDFYLSSTRNIQAAKRFLGKALRGLKECEKPKSINTDKAPTYAAAIAELKDEGICPPDLIHRQTKYLCRG